MPWAVIVAAHRSRDITAFRYKRARTRSGELRAQEVSFVYRRLHGQPGRQWTAQVGANSRGEAEVICSRVRRSGIPCMVLKN